MDELRIDWASAQARDGELVVALEGDAPKGWAEHFASTVRLLNHDSWPEIELEDGEVHVSGVTDGDEDRLRHFLEAVVLQVNSAVAQDEHEAAAQDADDASGDGASKVDRGMTERFRGFADASEQTE